MFTLEEIIKNKNKREEFIEECKSIHSFDYLMYKEKLVKSVEKNNIEQFVECLGNIFSWAVVNNILKERIPSQKELPEMKYMKTLNCCDTNIEKIPPLENLKKLICWESQIKNRR